MNECNILVLYEDDINMQSLEKKACKFHNKYITEFYFVYM